MSEQQRHRVGTVKSIEELPKKEQIKALYEQKEITQTKALIDLAYATTEEFFKCDLGIAATIKTHGIQKNVLLGNLTFSRWLVHQYYSLFQDSPKANAVKDAINTILSIEEFENHNYQEVFIRIAYRKDKIYIDLVNEASEVIEISKEGWNIIKNPPVKFIHMDTMRPLPVPKRNGDISKIRSIFQMTDQQFQLWLSFIFGCFNPKGPFPVLVLEGTSGSGKTLLSEITKAIVDPAFAPVRTLPKTEEDLLVMAQKNWLLVFDNLSGISNRMSDALCKLSTGGGFTRRKLYTNSEESVITATRPVIVNGIEHITRRQDLADRAIVLSLPYISPESRKTKAEIWDEFEQLSGSIIGFFCNAVSMALKKYPNTEIKQKPRMADFAKWVTAAEPSLGFKDGEFLDVFMKNRQEIAEEAIEHDVLVFSIIETMKNKSVLEGPASYILDCLKSSVPLSYAESVEWVPPNKLKSAITRIEPILLSNGIQYKYKKNGKGRIHAFIKMN
jgi:hypothetical protein